MTNKQATEAPERQRTPEQIIGNDAFTQLIFEGYEIVSSGELATAKQAGIDEGLEMAAKFIEENKVCQMGNFRPIRPMKSGELISVKQIEYATAIRALKSEKANG